MGSFTCYICHAQKSLDFVHKHHKVPKSLGGSDAPDNLLDLCSGCHADMHTLARICATPRELGR